MRALVLSRANARSQSRLAGAFAAEGVRGYHFRLLAALDQHGPSSQADLGRQTGIDRSDVVATLDELVAEGFAVREPDPADRRNVVTITEPGADALERLDAVLASVQDAVLTSLTARERTRLIRLLRELIADPPDGRLSASSGAFVMKADGYRGRVLGKTYGTQVCSIARALEVVGERWSLLIIRDALFAKVTRFSDFQHNLGIATNILTTRLDGFIAAGVMERRRSSTDADQHEYVLSDKGRDLAAALIALTEWGDRWAAPDEPPILYRHAECGGTVDQQIVCATCGPAVAAAEVEVQIGPGMPAEYLANRRPRRTG